jgi:hypothetical protein
MSDTYVDFWMAKALLGKDHAGVVEVMREPGSAHPYLVLLSELVGEHLHCRIGFATKPALCDAMGARGFICIEARINLEGSVLKVNAAAFVPDQREIVYDHQWLKVTGVAFEAGEPGEPPPRSYQQVLSSPDLVLPAQNVRMVTALWSLDRQQVSSPATAGCAIEIAELRWPKTPPATVGPDAVWTGTIVRSKDKDIWGDADKELPRREARPVEFSSYRSSFRAVEVLGARLEVPRYDARRKFEDNVTRQSQQELEFYGLIAPLNFHLPPDAKKQREEEEEAQPEGSRPDFYYRPATSGLTIELLRYGRMSVAEPVGGMEPDDIQSQHELLVRVVVGRVDEDACQAQEVTTFVPALFVDNTWSKHLGRQYMGLDKRLAHFCTKEGEELVPLSPEDACDRRDSPALWRIAEIRLANELLPPLPAEPKAVGEDDTEEEKAKKNEEEAAFAQTKAARSALLEKSPLLLTIECDRDMIDGWDDFRAVPTDAVLRNSPLAARRWRQEDFEEAEVRRDFARAAGQGSAGSFLGTQSTPLPAARKKTNDGKWTLVTDDGQEDRRAAQTWVSGRYSMTGSAMMARPRGKIQVTMYRVRNDPVEAWERLCDLFEVRSASGDDPGSRTFTLGPGSWYRLQYDMELAMQDGVD